MRSAWSWSRSQPKSKETSFSFNGKWWTRKNKIHTRMVRLDSDSLEKKINNSIVEILEWKYCNEQQCLPLCWCTACNMYYNTIYCHVIEMFFLDESNFSSDNFIVGQCSWWQHWWRWGSNLILTRKIRKSPLYAYVFSKNVEQIFRKVWSCFPSSWLHSVISFQFFKNLRWCPLHLG